MDRVILGSPMALNIKRNIKLLALFCMLAFSACGTTSGSALPQASTPVDELIEVSSPDENGVVTISGVTGAVADSSLVLIEIGSESEAQLSPDLNHYTDWMFPQAQAQNACSTAFPECNEDITEGTCFVQAEDDGSFNAEVTAPEGRSITISYQDPANGCKEKVATEKEVKSVEDGGLIGLAVEAQGMAYDRNDDELILVGDAAGDVKRVVVKDAQTGFSKVASHNIDNLNGELQGIQVFTDSLGVDLLLVMTDEQALISRKNGINSATVEYVDPLNGENVAFKRAIAEDSVHYFDDLSACPAIGADLEGVTASRIIASRLIDADSSIAPIISAKHPIAIIDGLIPPVNGFVQARGIVYDFNDLGIPDDLILNDVADINIFYDADGHARGYFLASFENQNDASQEDIFYLIEIPLFDDTAGHADLLCEALVDSTRNVQVFKLPSRLRSPSSTTVIADEDALTALGKPVGSRGYLLIADSKIDDVVLVDLDEAPPAAGGVIDLSDEDSLLEPLEDSLLVGIQTLMGANIAGNPYLLMGAGESNKLFKLELEIDEASGVAQFTEINSDVVLGVSPLFQMQTPTADPNIFNLVTLLKGNADDNRSGLRILSSDKIISSD